MPTRDRNPGNGNLWVRESNLMLTDKTVADVSTTKHGLTPKAPNDATKFLDGTGAWTVPAGGGTNFAGYPFAQDQVNFTQQSHAAGDFTTGIYFQQLWNVTCSGLKFGWDGFASKTVKWTVWDKGLIHGSSTSLDSGTVAATAGGIYTATFASPIVFTQCHWYTLALYINDGTNYIKASQLPGHWFGASAQSHFTVGAHAYWDIAVFAAGDAEPISNSGSNSVPVELVPS